MLFGRLQGGGGGLVSGHEVEPKVSMHLQLLVYADNGGTFVELWDVTNQATETEFSFFLRASRFVSL